MGKDFTGGLQTDFGAEIPPQSEPNPLVERTLEFISRAGLQTIDPHDFNIGIDDLYNQPDIDSVIEEELPKILAADPQLLLRNQINLTGVPERLTQLYADDPQMKARYDDPVDRVAYSFKVWLRHVRYFLQDHPDPVELEYSIKELKKILEGRFIEKHVENKVCVCPVMFLEHVDIPNIYFVGEEDYYIFESYDCVEKEVGNILVFLVGSEARKVTMSIMSAGTDPAARAERAEELFERYLNGARERVLDPDKPIPEFYDRESKLYKLIERARDSIILP